MAYDKVVDSAVLEAGLTLVGDSIRAKGGTSAKLEFPNGMKAAVEAIDTSKPEQTKTATPSLSQQTISPDSGKVLSGVTVEPITSTLLTSLDADFKAENIAKGVNMFGVIGTMQAGGLDEAILDKTITEYSNDSLSVLGYAAFAKCYSLTDINLPNVVSIGESAFTSCKSLVRANIPNAEYVASNAFSYCSNLQSATFPNLSRIRNSAFYGCTMLSTCYFPKVTAVGYNAFEQCANIVSVDLPVCSMLAGFNFRSCGGITSVNLPACVTISNYAFSGCYNIPSIDLPVCTLLSSYAFFKCSSLSRLTLRASSVCSLGMSSVFSGTGITSSTGYIYVPASLVNSYKAATNWALFSNRIYSITT